MAFLETMLGLSLAVSAAQDAAQDAAPASPPQPEPALAEPQALLSVDPDLRALVCPFKGRIDYEPGAISCGTIAVPENREAAQSRTLRLMYIKIAATGDEAERRADPAIYLTGGPGATAEGYVGRLRDHDLVRTRDLYILEQRGIANSTGLCPQFNTLSPGLADPRTMAEIGVAGAERTALCFSEAQARGVDLRGYNTQENARDVAALRQALGFEQWNVWGISYGSHLGQMVMQEDPGGVRAIVLDAIVPNDLGGGFGDFARMADTVLENFRSACPAGAPCDGFDTRMFETIEQMQAEPVLLQVDDPETAPSGEVWVPPLVLIAPAFLMSYEQDQYPAVPAVTDALSALFSDPEPAVLDGLAAALSQGGVASPLGGGGEGMSAAVQCNDGYVTQSLADNADTGSPFAGMVFTREGGDASLAVCERFGLTRRSGPAYAIPEAAAPTLIVNGAWDPVTPPWLAEYIHERMPGARLIITPNAGHGPTRSMPECAGPVMTAFFDNPDVTALDAACLEAGVEPPVYPAFVGTNAPARILPLMAGAPASFIGPALWAGLPVLILAGGLIIILTGFFARLIDRRPATELAADTGGARVTAFATTLAGLAGLALLGAGAYTSIQITPLALLGGLLGPAQVGVWLVLAAAALGAFTLILLVRAIGAGQVRFGTLTGFGLIGLGAIALALFMLWMGVSPL